MNKEFIPYEQALDIKELGFDEVCFTYNDDSKMFRAGVLYRQAFRFFREKYGFTYSIGNTNIAVIHYLGTTQLLQNNDSYEAAELAVIKWFIDVAKQQ